MNIFILTILNILIFICMEGIFGILQKILNRLFGSKWICEYCGAIEYAHKQPYCKPCCHIHRSDIKMHWIKR